MSRISATFMLQFTYLSTDYVLGLCKVIQRTEKANVAGNFRPVGGNSLRDDSLMWFRQLHSLVGNEARGWFQFARPEKFIKTSRHILEEKTTFVSFSTCYLINEIKSNYIAQPF